MSESNQHNKLVQQLIVEIKKIIPEDKWILIQSDTFSSASISPKFSEGYRPDVYYEFDGLMFVGEAKTSKDIESTRSLLQYESFLRSCSLFQGKALFYMAVPFTEYATAVNLIEQISKKHLGEYETKIIKGYV